MTYFALINFQFRLSFRIFWSSHGYSPCDFNRESRTSASPTGGGESKCPWGEWLTAETDSWLVERVYRWDHSRSMPDRYCADWTTRWRHLCSDWLAWFVQRRRVLHLYLPSSVWMWPKKFWSVDAALCWWWSDVYTDNSIGRDSTVTHTNTLILSQITVVVLAFKDPRSHTQLRGIKWLHWIADLNLAAETDGITTAFKGIGPRISLLTGDVWTEAHQRLRDQGSVFWDVGHVPAAVVLSDVSLVSLYDHVWEQEPGANIKPSL